MKIRLIPSQQGNVLLGTMIVSGLLGVAMASYLKLVSQEYSIAHRSQSWNMAMPVAEAGVEEALTHLYFNAPSNMVSDGWTQTNGNAFVKQRVLCQDEDQNAWYQVIIVGTNNPIIFSQGYVRLRAQTNDISRKVLVTTRRDGLFTKGMVAKEQIDLNGNGVTADSFDSADPNFSTNGGYDPGKRKDNGDIASNSGLINSLDVGNADIWGSIATGPGGGVAIGPQGSVGDLAWLASGTNGIQEGHYTSDMNVSFPTVAVPFTDGYFTPTRQTIAETTITMVTNPVVVTTGNGNDKITTTNGYNIVTNIATANEPVYVLSASGNWMIHGGLDGSLIVRSNVHASLLVTDSFKFSAKQSIKIESGASLKFYMQGASADIGGQGIFNENGNPTNFFYFGLPSNTGLSIKGNGGFTGIIYAPEASFTLSGGGKDLEDFIGASVTMSVNMNGHFNFHYDENLARLFCNRGYIVTSWQEL
jgi:hypothetical protein